MPVLRKIVATALSLGAVHVLTGPDHLSALATLSANVGYVKAFWFGVRWGIGHSMGLILVGGVFIAIDAKARSHHTPSNNITNTTTVDAWDTSSSGSTVLIPDKVAFAMNTLVGIFMILLGSYGLYRVYRQIQHNKSLVTAAAAVPEDLSAMDTGIRGTQYHNTLDLEETEHELEKKKLADSTAEDTEEQREPSHHHSGTIVSAAIVIPRPDDVASQNLVQELDGIHMVEFTHIHNTTEQEPTTTIINNNNNNNNSLFNDRTADPHHHTHVHSHVVSFGELWNRKPLLALLIGVVHGVSGPGGVLGVIPAVQIHNTAHGFLYLGIFCITSTFVMGVFACFYGMMSHTLSRKCTCSCSKYPYITTAVCIELFSCFCSFFVGVLWIVLQATHKMDQIFGS